MTLFHQLGCWSVLFAFDHSLSHKERTVTITGSEDAVDKAARAIEEILSSDKKSLAHQPEHKKIMYVSGAFIGSLGQTVKQYVCFYTFLCFHLFSPVSLWMI